MGCAGMCCDDLEEPKALMKMGLSVILVGHVNFLLGALVHGIVLRQINLHEKARGMGYAITNVVTLITGMLGLVNGILAIILSKNKKSKRLTWSLFSISLVSSLVAGGSTIGLLASVVRTILNSGRLLLTHCRFPMPMTTPALPTSVPLTPPVYSTTVVLWVGLIVSCSIQMVFSARCLAACVSFLGLPGFSKRMRRKNYTRPINVGKPAAKPNQPRYTEAPRRHHDNLQAYMEPPRVHNLPPRHHTEQARHHNKHSQLYANSPGNHNKPSKHYTEPPKSNNKPSRRTTAPPKLERQAPPRHLPLQSMSLPSRERQPLRQSPREWSDIERQETRTGRQQRRHEQQHDLRRGAVDRSSFWI